MLQRLKEVYTNDAGANLVEYIILVGVIALIALAGFRTFGKNVDQKVQEQASQVSGIGK